MDESSDASAGEETVRALFALIKALAPRFDRPGGLFAFMGIDSIVFPYADVRRRIVPAFAGMAGLIKTAAKEMPAGRFKAVDFSDADPLAQREELVDAFVAEILSDDPRVEAGYAQGRRHVISLVQATAAGGASMVQDGDTLLVTGGARGITHAILTELVRQASVHLVILGRSDIDGADAPVGVDRAALMEEMKQRMPGAKPVAIQRAVEKVLGLRQAAANIETLRSRGARVDYHAVDVADFSRVSDILGRYGRIDGVIHAAGIERSRFMEKKSQEEFNRVFDTKVCGTANLLRALESRPWRYFFVFSSVTARFGNEAQADYTAANDMMGKMLQRHVDDQPARIGKVLDWTAWEGAGMATDATVQKVLTEKGLAFLPLDRGVRFFVDELCDPRSVEAVFTGKAPAFDRDGIFGTTANAEPQRLAPFLDGEAFRERTRVLFHRRLDLAHDRFLLDHSREGIPIFLGATGIEAMAEAAARLTDDGRAPTELAGFDIPYGIKILRGRPRPIRIEAVRRTEEAAVVDCRIFSRFQRPGQDGPGEETLHYRGTFRFDDRQPQAGPIDLPALSPVDAAAKVERMVYHPDRLFMDGLFRSVDQILHIDERTLVTRLKRPEAGPFFTGGETPDFLTDVVLVDAMFQSCGIFAFLTGGDVALPRAMDRMSFFQRPVGTGPFLCRVARAGDDRDHPAFDVDLTDGEGRPLIKAANFAMVRVGRLSDGDPVRGWMQSLRLKAAS